MPSVSDSAEQRLLAIDTSSRQGSLSISWNLELHHAQLKDSRAHASDLLPALDQLLEAAGAQRVNGVLPFTAVIVGTGPGSYTGLRIGIATARALAWASQAQLIGIPSFEALAFGALVLGERGAIAQDARAGKFYFARYERSAEGLIELDAPQLLTAEALGKALANEEILLAEETLVAAAELDAAHAAKLRPGAWPSAAALLCLAQERLGAGEASPVEPLYLREFGQA